MKGVGKKKNYLGTMLYLTFTVVILVHKLRRKLDFGISSLIPDVAKGQ